MNCSRLEPNRSVGEGRLRVVIAIACFFAMTACSDSTGPSFEEPTVAALTVLAAELHDAADVFAQGVGDQAVRGRAELAVTCLGDQLLAGKVLSSRTALFQARLLLADLDDVSAIELAPVGLALDHIERRMNQILVAGAQAG